MIADAIAVLSVAGLYAIVSLAIALTFGVMRLVNFAQGDFVMVGAYAMLVFAAWPWPVMVVAGILAAAAVAAAAQWLAFRPLRDASPSTLMVASFAVSELLENLATLVLGSLPRSIGLPPGFGAKVSVGSASVPATTLMSIAAALVVGGAAAVLLTRTKMGIRLRAASEDFLMARLLGVKSARIMLVAFIASGLISGVVAIVFVGQVIEITPTMGQPLTIIGFTATVIGGLGSLTAAAAAGFSLGVVTVILQITLPISLSPFRDAWVYLAVFVVLVIRPGGLFVADSVKEDLA